MHRASVTSRGSRTTDGKPASSGGNTLFRRSPARIGPADGLEKSCGWRYWQARGRPKLALRGRKSSMSAPETGLVGDIGATNARFALVWADGTTSTPRAYVLDDHPSLVGAIDAYLTEEAPLARPRQAVLAVAC